MQSKYTQRCSSLIKNKHFLALAAALGIWLVLFGSPLLYILGFRTKHDSKVSHHDYGAIELVFDQTLPTSFKILTRRTEKVGLFDHTRIIRYEATMSEQDFELFHERACTNPNCECTYVSQSHEAGALRHIGVRRAIYEAAAVVNLYGGLGEIVREDGVCSMKITLSPEPKVAAQTGGR